MGSVAIAALPLVGSSLCQQPAMPSSHQIRRGNEIALTRCAAPPTTLTEARARCRCRCTAVSSNPIYASVGSSILAPAAHRSVPLSRPRPTGTKLLSKHCRLCPQCWPKCHIAVLCRSHNDGGCSCSRSWHCLRLFAAEISLLRKLQHNNACMRNRAWTFARCRS